MLEGVKAWLLNGAAVLDEPRCSLLYFVNESEVSAGRAAPRNARLLQGGADLRLI